MLKMYFPTVRLKQPVLLVKLTSLNPQVMPLRHIKKKYIKILHHIKSIAVSVSNNLPIVAHSIVYLKVVHRSAEKKCRRPKSLLSIPALSSVFFFKTCKLKSLTVADANLIKSHSLKTECDPYPTPKLHNDYHRILILSGKKGGLGLIEKKNECGSCK